MEQEDAPKKGSVTRNQYLVLILCVVMIVLELLLISRYASSGAISSFQAVNPLNGALSSNKKESGRKRYKGPSESERINGDVLNPVEDAFMNRGQREQAQSMGLK